METRFTEMAEEPLAETPEDVAILYSWANLHGAKYRDFSASRREYRAQVRHRAAEDLRVSELQAKADAEAAAVEAERAAREAERLAHATDGFDGRPERERALRDAEDAARRAAAERVEAARRAEAAAIAEAIARREEREIAEAHASAQRQAKSYANSDARRRSLAGPQPTKTPALTRDPYESAEHPGFDADRNTPVVHLSYDSRDRYRDELMGRPSGQRPVYRPELEIRRRPQGYQPDEASNVYPSYRAGGSPEGGAAPVRARINASNAVAEEQRRNSPAYPQSDRGRAAMQEQEAPAWLYSSSGSQPAVRNTPVPDTLQHSQERVAARWFALKGVFEPGTEPSVRQPAEVAVSPRQKSARSPVLAVFSLAGGVGKTSLVATLGRALSSLGEKVLLTDTTSHGLLPFYFGATELRPGVVRTFSPPSGSTDAPIHLVSYDMDKLAANEAGQETFIDEMAKAGAGSERVLLDLNSNTGWLIGRLGRMNPTVLVPVAPDMNSVISLQAVEKYFQGVVDVDGRPILPFYVLNGFDASLPLHLDVREVLRGKLGDRLLPFVVRRSPAVSEALAEGMTVVDYAAEAPIAEDYLNIAGWLRRISSPADPNVRSKPEVHSNRWSER